MALKNVSLDDKYACMEGRVHITGSQAFVRLAVLQARRDSAAGLNTACYISGYRGSPMHNIDKELWRAGDALEDGRIHFWPAVNEDLAATAIWGTQQIGEFGDATVDGVFAMWYGKGPGLDRSMDAIRHGHLAGSAKHGGVLIVVGDDHALTSTDAPAAHEYAFVELMMPLLYPSSVQDIIEYGLYGYAMSRYSGAWVGLKAIPDTVDASTSLNADPDALRIVTPRDFQIPPDGLNLRIPDTWHQQEPRHRQYKLDAALAFARANQINRTVVDSPQPRYGIIASGKAYADSRQALSDLGVSEQVAANVGIRVLKLAMPYPLDTETVRQFASGLEEILVVEEKHRLTETNVRDALYTLPDAHRPRVVGQLDENAQPLLPVLPELSPAVIARVLAQRIRHFHNSDKIRHHLALLDQLEQRKQTRSPLSIVRQPYFCSGCPHNSSTKVPAGSRAHGGVGCHYMATYMDRNNVTHSHMGGEGLTWVGQSAFVKTDHVFQNLGDGTYYHSGLLAIRACIAAGVNITFKILFNDAVAMTGGQPVDGQITPAIISRQVRAEGVDRIYVVSDQPDNYTGADNFAPGTVIKHRRELEAVQLECREISGTSLLIYDQTCAAEKRRRRKSGVMEDPDRRIYINDRVCEGCGDCGTKSNCMSVTPLDTPFGRKRKIDQSACNKDYSCVQGFCPSFVSVIGGQPRKTTAAVEVPSHLRILPEPDRPQLNTGQVYSILVTGVGGTGVVTIGALLSMAVHMEGNHFATVDQFGMAQKGGAVTSHIRLAAREQDIYAVRVSSGSADLVLGCDSLVTAGDIALDAVAPAKTRIIQNSHQQITGQFNRDRNLRFPIVELDSRLATAADADHIESFNASAIATQLLGDSIGSNLFMLGYAYQKGLIPVSASAIEAAIELNAVAVDMNKSAFIWGRRAARDLATVVDLVDSRQRGHDNKEPPDHKELQDHKEPRALDDLIEMHVNELTAYQNHRYASRYRNTVEQVRNAEHQQAGSEILTTAVAHNLYKLMAYKDEYEVARLYSDGRFEENIEKNFEGDYRLVFHLAPPLLASRDPQTGQLQKRDFGGWMLTAMRVLARLRFLRGTVLDVFGYSNERRVERTLLKEYETTILRLTGDLSADNCALATEIASLPDQVRGYGHVSEQSIQVYAAHRQQLLEQWPAAQAAVRKSA